MNDSPATLSGTDPLRLPFRVALPARRLVYVSSRSVDKVMVSGNQPISLYRSGFSRSSPVLLTDLVKSAHPVCDEELQCGPGEITEGSAGRLIVQEHAPDRAFFLYAILRRLNTGTLAKSKVNAKTTAATSVPPTKSIGRGVMAIPQVASVEAISRSTTDYPMSHRLGREDHRRRRSRFV